MSKAIALSLHADGRIHSAWKVLPNGNYAGMPIVDSLPEGNLPDYKYIDGEYIYDPLPKPEVNKQRTQEERITALETQLAAYEAAFAEGVAEGWA